jgi:hypothetical protein
MRFTAMNIRAFYVSSFLCCLSLALSISVYAQPGNDICSSAIDLQEFLPASQGQPLAGPYTNVGATGNDVDIASVTGCWLDDLTGSADGSSPQVDATVWFHFQGWDGTLMLYVQPCDTSLAFISEDTQMALFSGECDSLQLVSCNEDVDAVNFNYWSGITTSVQANTSYYVAIDGFNYSGFGSPDLPLTTGEFCFSFTQPTVEVPEISVAKSTVFPNPSSGKVQLTADSFLKEVSVFNTTGAECMRLSLCNTRTHELELPEAPGIYTLVVRTEMGMSVHRVIKN